MNFTDDCGINECNNSGEIMITFFIYFFAFMGVFFGGVSIGISAAFDDMKKKYNEKEFLQGASDISRMAKIFVFITIILLIIHLI